MSRLIFAIDTSSVECSISILEENKVLLESNFASAGELSKTLVSNIDAVLLSLNIKIGDIDLIGVSTGPGLFTGIRVGLSTLKGFFFDTDIPVVPVNSLHAIASKVRHESRMVVSVLDARRGEVYTGKYLIENGFMKEIIVPSLVKAEDLKGFLKCDKEVCFTGNGIGVYGEVLRKEFPKCLLYERSPFIASEIGLIANQEFLANNHLNGIGDVEPLYIRIPDAEKNFVPSNG